MKGVTDEEALEHWGSVIETIIRQVEGLRELFRISEPLGEWEDGRPPDAGPHGQLIDDAFVALTDRLTELGVYMPNSPRATDGGFDPLAVRVPLAVKEQPASQAFREVIWRDEDRGVDPKKVLTTEQLMAADAIVDAISCNINPDAIMQMMGSFPEGGGYGTDHGEKTEGWPQDWKGQVTGGNINLTVGDACYDLQFTADGFILEHYGDLEPVKPGPIVTDPPKDDAEFERRLARGIAVMAPPSPPTGTVPLTDEEWDEYCRYMRIGGVTPYLDRTAAAKVRAEIAAYRQAMED